MIFDCECIECIWNDGENCNAPTVMITIGIGGVCDAYEEREEDETE